MKKALSVILMLLLILGLFPQISLQTFAADINTIHLQYDDHMDITGKVVQILDAGSAAQGPVITPDGNHLVATGIGSAEINIDGTDYTVTVEKAKLNLIMIMGQSNAGNHFKNATSDVTCPIGTAYWWGNGLGTAATEPVAYTQPSMGFHTPLLAELYAQSVADGNPVKNVMIWHEGITSKDGQSITKWASSATNTSGTDDAVTMLKNCQNYYRNYSDRFEIVSSGIYWLQGESDLTMNPTTYIQRFMAMWNRLKDAGMEYVAFFRVRRGTATQPADWDDLRYSASLSAQIKMINDNPEFYMATTITENWIGTVDVEHTIDISKYITMMETYGKQASYSDQYGNTATYADGKLTTNMRTLFGSNNRCHYGKFGYAIIGADAAYNMYRAFHKKKVALVVANTSGHAYDNQVRTNGHYLTIDISDMTENLSFRAECGSTAGTLRFIVRSCYTDITQQAGVIASAEETYYSVSTSALRNYSNVSIVLIYTTTEGIDHTVLCTLQNNSTEPIDYAWDFNEDLNARSADGEILNSFLDQSLTGSYTIENGCLNAHSLQLALENTIALHATKNWSIEWKYGALNGGTAGFLLCEDEDNTVGNKALWHTKLGNLAIADYLDSKGYRNYTCDDIIIQDYDRLKLCNTYDPISGKNSVSLWINDQLTVENLQQNGSINGYDDNRDMSDYPLVADFAFSYLGNCGLNEWLMNCQLDYLKISFGDIQLPPVEETYYLVGFINGNNYGCEEDYKNMGQYVFEDGQLTTTFASDSYVFVKTENNGKWFMTDGWQGITTSATLYNTDDITTPEKLYVPGGVEVTFTLEENDDGSLILSYTKNGPSTIPTVSLKYPSVSFEDVITMNIYFAAENLQDVVEMGLITYSYKEGSYGVETAEAVLPGYAWSEEEGLYYTTTAGIAPKDIGDTIYFAVYAKLADGTYSYTNLVGYSPKTYAYNQLKSGTTNTKALMVAMLNYSTASQAYFHYKTDTPINANLTTAQKNMVASYSSSMISTVTQPSNTKLGTFINDGTYITRYPSISFEGAFCINYYFQPSLAVQGDVTMYLWNLEDYKQADVLTRDNATEAVTMTLTESGEYTAVVDGIAAKDLDKAVYVSFIYSDGTMEHCGGVIGYSIGMYCRSQAPKTGALSELSKVCAVYGYYAKQLFN